MTYTQKKYEAEITAFEKAHGKDTMFVENGHNVTKKEFWQRLMKA